MKLSPRLKIVADMVRRDSRFADIGTDHGYLPVWLVNSGKNKGGIAADLREGPLKNAAETLRIYGVESKISLRLSNGLDCILPHEADDIIFAGMGGTLIVELLEKAAWIKDKSKRIITQPMTHSQNVREFFCKNGFEIIEENACRDDGRDYICLCAEYTAAKADKPPLFYYIGSHPLKNNAPSLSYAKKQIDLIKTRADSLKNAGIKSDEYFYLKNILDDFKEEKPWQE